ncbi:MAG: phosphotransferase family protein [Dehalococcoidia bacterium]
MSDPQIDRLLFEALIAAGLPTDYREAAVMAPGDTGSSNDHYVVTLSNGFRCVLREYRWPLRNAPDDLRRPELEFFVHGVVHRHGVPVPAVLATVELDGRSASLLEYVDGELMADVLRRGDQIAADHVWYSFGRALRRLHGITFPAGTHGRFKGSALANQSISAGAFIQEWALRSARQLTTLRPDLPIDLHALEATVSRVADRLQDTPSALLHFDVHPWNVLVAARDGVYECAALLDWENASVGDPTWDITLAEVLTAGPELGPSAAFYEGYGAAPSEPNRAACELAFMLSKASMAASRAVIEERRGHAWWVADAVEAYVRDLPRRLLRLKEKL